jgi:acetyl esterase/lipase
MRRRTFLLAASAAAIAGPAFAAPAPRTYRYASTPGVKPDLQSLDIYGGREGGKRPIVAFIHGGGWSIGDKSNSFHGAQKAPAFVERGYVFASLNYRLSPAVMHPAHVQDVAAAIAWLHEHAAAFGGDAQRLVVMGHSAGAHLAALVATDARRLGAHGLALSALKGSIPIDGAGYNIPEEMREMRRFGPLARMYRDAFGTDARVWEDASPGLHAAGARGMPPFFIPHTARAAAVQQSRELAEAVRRGGSPAETFLSPNQNHMQINRQIGEPGDKVTAAMLAAIARWVA